MLEAKAFDRDELFPEVGRQGVEAPLLHRLLLEVVPVRGGQVQVAHLTQQLGAVADESVHPGSSLEQSD